GARGRRLKKLAVDRPDFVHVLAVLRLVSQHLRAVGRTENVGVDERKMRHVEKILDDAVRTRMHSNTAAADDAPVGLVELRDRGQGSRRLSQRGEDAAVALLDRQLAAGAAFFVKLDDLESIRRLAAHLDVLAEN